MGSSADPVRPQGPDPSRFALLYPLPGPSASLFFLHPRVRYKLSGKWFGLVSGSPPWHFLLLSWHTLWQYPDAMTKLRRPVFSCLHALLTALPLLLLLLAGPVRADIGPLQTLVVVNIADRESRALGAYYLEKHGIPPETHRCELKLSRLVGQNISLEDFERDIRAPIEAHIEQHGLRGQIQLVVFCWRGPTRVGGDNSLSSAFFYGYKTRPADANSPCAIPPDSRSGYYEATRSYSATAGYSPLRSPLAFVLTARTLDDAKAVVDRAVAGHAAAPADAAYLFASSIDAARNVRVVQFPAVSNQLRRLGVEEERILVTASPPATVEQPLLFATLGQATIPSNWLAKQSTVRLLPGAVGEHLTSCGGQLPTPCFKQSCVWDWLGIGATVSYGTVSEPCNYTVKFPHARLATYIARGFSLAEALAMSVSNPYQGLFAGDPLCSPCARPPTIAITYPPPNSAVTSNAPLVLRLDLAAHPDGLPPTYLDLYVDGRHYTPMARPKSPAGNEIRFSVGPYSIRHTVGRGEDLDAAIQSFAFTLRMASSNQLRTAVSGDLLFVSLPADAPLPVACSVDKGLAAAPFIGVRLVSGQTTLPEPTALPGEQAMQTVTLQFHMGAARSFSLEYLVDLSFLPRGLHHVTIVARDGSALQTQGQTTLPILRK